MLSVEVKHRFEAFALDAAFTADTGVTVLFGPSGCGKSTLLNVVAGLLRPQHGIVRFAGETLLDTAAGTFMRPEHRRCGVVFQDARLMPHFSVATNLRYGARRAPLGTAGPGFDEVVALLGLGGLLDRRPRTLSGGERQRVAIGRALLARPRLLLMDEPLASLDHARRSEILPYLDRLRHVFALPLLYVTHAMDEVDRLADAVVLMDDGRVVASGPIETLTARTDLPILSGRRDAGAVLACTISAHDAAQGLSRLDFGDGSLIVPLRPEPVGTAVRVRVLARDVSLATARPERISSQNILPAIVTALDPATPNEVFVAITVGRSQLYARLTRHSVSELGLSTGIAVFAIVKSTMFDR